MPRRSVSLARFRSLLEVDPEALEGVLARIRGGHEPLELPLAAADWERLIQILKHGLDRVAAGELRLLAVELVGEIYEHELGEPERALRWWAQLLTAPPHRERAAAELERLARSSGDWRRLVQVYHSALTRSEPPARPGLVLRLARVHLEELAEADRAQQLLEGLWEKERDGAVLEALQALYRRVGRKDQLASLLRQRIGQAEAADRVELWLQLGFLQDVELGAPELALESYREALRLDRTCAAACEALQQICLRQERWSELLMIYEGLASSAATPAEAAQQLVRMARICDDAIGDRARSQKLWRRLRELRPQDPALLEEMEGRFEPMARWDELCEVLVLQARTAGAPRRARLIERQARLCADRLRDLPRAIGCWREVVELEPENVPALLALSDACGQAGQWEDLARVLQQLLVVADRAGREPDFLVPLHALLAQVAAQELNRPELAIESWQRVLALRPADAQALESLERLLEAELRWTDCVEILERQLEAARLPSEQTELLLRLAAILRDGVGDPLAASRALERALELDPTEEEAHRGLCELHRERGDWQALGGQIFAWLESVSDTRLAVALLQEAAVLYEERLGQLDKAFLIWQSALKQDPAGEVTTSNLERLAAALGCWDDLLQVYQAAVEATPSARVRVALLTAMGRCHGLELGDLERAVALLYQALNLDPEAIAALEVLEECYRRSCRWGNLLAVLRRHAELEREPSRQVPLLVGVGQLQCRLGAAEQALVTYRKVLELDPTYGDALLALEALDLAFGLWAELATVLERQLALGLGPQRRAAAFQQLGEVREQQLGDPEGAIAAYREALTLDPDRLEVMHALERLYDQTGESEAYLDIVERQLDLSEDAEHRACMLERVAGAWEEQLGRRDRAMACLEKLLLVDAGSRAAHLGLARLCAEAGEQRRLAEVLRRHADAAEGSERLGLLLELGGLLADTLRELPLAAEVYAEALELGPADARALGALAVVEEKRGSWAAAAGALERLAEVVEQGPARAQILLRLARVEEAELGRPARAERCYQRALAEDDACFEAMQRLVEILRAREDWAVAAAMMVRAAAHTSHQARRAQLLFEAGLIQLERLRDQDAAAELLARALEVDPDHVRAGLPLSQIYERQGRLAELEPVLDMLVRKADPRDRGHCRDLHHRLGCVARALGKPEKAVRCLLEARGLDYGHLPTLQALAELQFQMGAGQEASKTLQTILVHHREQLSAEEVADLFFKLGAIKEQLADPRRALGYQEKALEVLPSYRPSLEAVVRLEEGLGHWDPVVRTKSRLVAVVAPEERPQLLEECAEIHRQRRGDLVAATEAYLAAAALRPDDRPLLHRVLDFLGQARRWPEALQVVLRLAGLEEPGPVRAQLLYTAAAICRDELDQADRALQLFEEALDASPDHLKAFEAIDRLCTARKDWLTLARAYQRMIARQGDEVAASLRAMLWHNLGEVQRTRLRQVPEAIAAFEAASRLEPQDLERHAILAELYQLAGPALADRAIAEHRVLLGRDPQRSSSMSALAALHGSRGEEDARLCICAVLDLVGRASAEEQALSRGRRPAVSRRARASVTAELWSQWVRHPAQDPVVGALLAGAAPLLVPRLARPPKQHVLRRKHRVRAEEPVAELCHHIAAALGAPVAEVYALPEQPVPLMLANTSTAPSVVLGAPLLAPMPEAELAFILGQQLTYLRPGALLCRLFPSPTQLRLALLSALTLASAALPMEPAEAAEVGRLLAQLPPAPALDAAELLAAARLLLERGGGLDLVGWWNAITQTANRVGLIFSGEVASAVRLLQLEPSPFGSTPASDRVRDLLAYAVSEDYFAVRRELGLRAV